LIIKEKQAAIIVVIITTIIQENMNKNQFVNTALHELLKPENKGALGPNSDYATSDIKYREFEYSYKYLPHIASGNIKYFMLLAIKRLPSFFDYDKLLIKDLTLQNNKDGEKIVLKAVFLKNNQEVMPIEQKVTYNTDGAVNG
jgi:hypothetical protein